MKELLKKKINANYKEISYILQTSEWGAKEIIENNGETTLNNLTKLFEYLGLKLIDTNKIIKYELSTEINQKIFRNYASYWLLKKKYEVRESTFANYCNLLNNTIIPCLGDIPCEKFNNKTLQHFAYWAKEKGGVEKKGVSEHYIKDCLLIIKAIIKDGQEEKIFPDFGLKRIKVPKTLMIENAKKTYTEEEYKKIIKYILENISTRSLGILIGIFTGMRIGEICALKWEDIDFKNKLINVNKTVQRIYNPLDEFEKSKIVITPCKTENSQRNIPIAPDLYKILKTLRTTDNDYILTGTNKLIEPRTFRKFYTKMMKECGIIPIKFHSLRHTFASINIENGTDIKTISEILGHSDISITLQTYTHTSNKAKAKAIDKFNKIFKNQSEKEQFVKSYKGNVCCINKRSNKCDFIGSIKNVSEYLAQTSAYVCDVINGIIIDRTYDIVPKIIGITYNENNQYVGG